MSEDLPSRLREEATPPESPLKEEDPAQKPGEDARDEELDIFKTEEPDKPTEHLRSSKMR
jgi:hypothetical protein